MQFFCKAEARAIFTAAAQAQRAADLLAFIRPADQPDADGQPS